MNTFRASLGIAILFGWIGLGFAAHSTISCTATGTTPNLIHVVITNGSSKPMKCNVNCRYTVPSKPSNGPSFAET